MKELSIRAIGRRGERIAARHLKRQGYKIVGKNLHYRKNELDIIAADRQYLVFVEVKTRTFLSSTGADTVRPATAVDAEKRKRTVEAAMAHLAAHHTELCPRFDVIEIYLDQSRRYRAFKINHIEDAFTASGKFRR